MNTKSTDSIEQRLRKDATRISVEADAHFTQRVSNQIAALNQSANPVSAGRQPSYWGWGAVATAMLALAIIAGQQNWPTPGQTLVEPEQPLIAHLEQDLTQALTSGEADLRSELEKVQSDWQRVERMIGLGGKSFSK